jgi:hypothetical protein
VSLSGIAGDGGAAPVLVGASSVAPAATSSLAPLLPASTQAGDYLVLCIYANSSTLGATLPAGWTSLGELTSTRGFHVWWLARLADGSGAAPTTTFSGQAGIASAALVAVRGVDATNPVDAVTTPSTLSGTVAGQQITFTAPALTTTGGADHLLSFFVYDSGDGDTWPSPPTGFTKQIDTGSLAVFDGAAALGANGPFVATATFNANSDNFGTALTVALAPP